MEEERSDIIEESTTSVIRIDEMSLGETQIAEQLYNSAGLDPVVDAGLKDYDKRLQLENRLMNKVLGTRGSDIRAYGEAVAKRVALAIYGQLNKQYGGRVGDMRSYIMALEDERDRANTKYDELMGRVIGILGDEYKELRTDSKVFVEKLTTVLGDDLKETRIDQKELTERLADIDGLRSQIAALDSEKEQLRQGYESQLAEMGSRHKEEKEELSSQIAALDNEKEQLRQGYESQLAEMESKHKEEVEGLESQIYALAREKEQLREEHESQVATQKAEHSAEVEGLKAQISELNGEKAQLREEHESDVAARKKEHAREVKSLRSQIARLASTVEGLEADKVTLTGEIAQWREVCARFKTASETLDAAIPYEEMRAELGEALYDFILKDSKVPDAVIEGVGKFIDFKKYLGMAVERGAKEAQKRAEEALGAISIPDASEGQDVPPAPVSE